MWGQRHGGVQTSDPHPDGNIPERLPCVPGSFLTPSAGLQGGGQLALLRTGLPQQEAADEMAGQNQSWRLGGRWMRMVSGLLSLRVSAELQSNHGYWTYLQTSASLVSVQTLSTTGGWTGGIGSGSEV